jgi:tRNA-splicing ligase RtcB
MSRTRARKTLDFKEEVKALDERGILHAIRGRSDLDEAPGSYKDIDEVMQNQTDLVEVQIELRPLAVIKG